MELWIAFRADGLAGAGTVVDPFDGSTADKLDAILREVPPQSAIHLAPGLYETRGNRDNIASGGWTAKEGWKISGAGTNLTTLKLIDCPVEGGLYWIIGNTRPGLPACVDNVEVTDLTCDCNLRGQPANCANGAIILYGNNLRVTNVRCVDWGTKLSGRECFVIQLNAQPPLGGGSPRLLPCVVDNCICDQPYEGEKAFSYNSMVILVGSAGRDSHDCNSYDFNGTIRNCVVDGTLKSGGLCRPNRITALAAFGKGAPAIHDNLVINCGVGVWNDSWVCRTLLIKNNRFHHVAIGVSMNMGWQGRVCDGLVTGIAATLATIKTEFPHNYEQGDLMAVIGSTTWYGSIQEVGPDWFSVRLPGTGLVQSGQDVFYASIWTHRFLQVEGNYMELTGPPLNNGDGQVFGGGITLGADPIFRATKMAVSIYQNIALRNNVIRLVDGIKPLKSLNFGIALDHVANGLVESNIIDAGRLDCSPSDGKLVAWQPTVSQGRLRFSNNRTTTGTLLKCYDFSNQRFFPEG